MENVSIPSENACTPDENAHEWLMRENMSPPAENAKTAKITFDVENVESPEKTISQNSSVYKEILSQPPQNLSHHQKLLWLQKRRGSGLYVQCDKCNRWRFMPDVLDNHELPNKWYCELNPDPNAASCTAPEVPIRLHDEDDLIHSEYTAGSVVWARMDGWPWWPAMVDDCPDTEQFYWLDGFSDIPTHYNVTFFDAVDVTRAWISPENLKPYVPNRGNFKNVQKVKKYKKRIEAGVTQANHAILLSVQDRLTKYSFIAKYKGSINSPKKVSKEILLKFQKKLKRKYNVDFPIENSSGSEDDTEVTKPSKRKNIILVGTPKRDKAEKGISRVTEKPQDKIHHTNKPQAKTDSEVIRNDDNENEVTEKIITPDEIVNGTRDSLLQTPQNESISEIQDSSVLNHLFKHPNNSLAVQPGSAESKANTEAFDNDSSRTYVPDSQNDLVTSSFLDTPNMKIRIATPGSDDFDF